MLNCHFNIDYLEVITFLVKFVVTSILIFMCAKKQRVPRTRNHFTQTESAFWGGIRAVLRQKSRWWVPKDAAKREAKRLYKGTNKRQKWEYQCASCKNWFKDKEVEVDHIIQAGSLKCAEDLPGFVTRLFCEIDGFQVLCVACHLKKTNNERKKI